MRVLIVAEHRLVREGIRALLERHTFDVVAEADDRDSAVRETQLHRPDVVILDLELPILGTVECVRQVLASTPKVGVILLTPHASDDLVINALRAGVKGCVAKTQPAGELLKAIREVGAGRTYLGVEASSVVARMCFERVSSFEKLTPRLCEVLRLIADGKTTREIAAIVGVGEKTAELYRSRIMTRLDVHDTAGLVRYAIRHGLVEL